MACRTPAPARPAPCSTARPRAARLAHIPSSPPQAPRHRAGTPGDRAIHFPRPAGISPCVLLPRRCWKLYALNSGTEPELVDHHVLDDLADAQSLGADAHAALAADRDGDGAARDAAAAALEEDVFVVQAASPAFEVPDFHPRIPRIDAAAALRLELDENTRIERQLLGRVEHEGRQIARVRHLDLDPAVGVACLHLQGWCHRRDAQVDRGLPLAHLGKDLVRRIAQADGRYSPAELDLAELWMLEALPRTKYASLVLLAVELGERQQVFAREPAVVIDERLLARDAQARKKVPELARIRDGAACVVDEVGDVAVDRLLRLVDELLEAAHHRIAADLLAPFADLAVDGEVLLVHLIVGRIAERPDVAAAEGVQVEPGEDVRMRARPVDHRARFGLARAVRAGTDLLVLRPPSVREVAVEVDIVVREVMRIRHVRAVVVLDRAFRPHLVERPGVFEPARQHDPRHLGIGDELARGILLAE